jgi:hypothetical protein
VEGLKDERKQSNTFHVDVAATFSVMARQVGAARFDFRFGVIVFGPAGASAMTENITVLPKQPLVVSDLIVF